MNTIEVYVDEDMISIIGFYCDLCINEINIMNEHFESVCEELFEQDGIYKMRVIFNPAEYYLGGLVNGSWYDFEQIDYKSFDEFNDVKGFLV